MEPRSTASSAARAPSSSSHRRTSSASSLFSKIGLLRSPIEADQRPCEDVKENADTSAASSVPVTEPAMASAVQQQKTRRRKGSLRKVALLGRGAQRDRRETSPLIVESKHQGPSVTIKHQSGQRDALGLGVDHTATQPGLDAVASRVSPVPSAPATATIPQQQHRHVRDSGPTYTSTTDEEDTLQLPPAAGVLRPGLAPSAASESYFSARAVSQTRRPGFQQAKSPLSFSGLASTPMPAASSDWDYSETEWWGWVVLAVTWFVFVVGMGSCLDIWSWAWDVGKTPYAPPELEDDPTLPIVGYYPALMILSCVMAWVWVVVAWVGLKYFRHAKISGD